MKKFIFGLVSICCLVGANGVTKLNKKEQFLNPEVKRINGDSPNDYSDAICCLNHYYFLDMRGYHIAKLNPKRNNGLVVIQHLLGYYNTMIDDQVIPENYEWNVSDFIKDKNNPTMDQFNDSPSSNLDYYNHIKKVYEDQKYKYDEDKGTTHAQDKKVLRKIWKEYNYGITENNLYIEPCDNNASDQWSGYSSKLATEQLALHHNPVIVRKDGEVGIAFAYNREYVWLATYDERDTYWGGIMKKPISFLKKAQVIAVKSNCFLPYRAYSDNYSFYTTQAKLWLGCYNHVLTTPNIDGYHEYYHYTDYSD